MATFRSIHTSRGHGCSRWQQYRIMASFGEVVENLNGKMPNAPKLQETKS